VCDPNEKYDNQINVMMFFRLSKYAFMLCDCGMVSYLFKVVQICGLEIVILVGVNVILSFRK